MWSEKWEIAYLVHHGNIVSEIFFITHYWLVSTYTVSDTPDVEWEMGK